MRKKFVQIVEDVMDRDPNSVLLLGDIGVFGFRSLMQKFPQRAYNIGILEQATVSLASGLAAEGFRPIVHTIAPFLVERSFEQIKIDFCYQNLPGKFVSVGSSYDYAALGCTHHCPGDIGILKTIPLMEIVVPGTAEEFESLFHESYFSNNPSYFRISERINKTSYDVSFGKAKVVQRGSLATVIAVGPMLDTVLKAVSGKDVTVLYYTTVAPFDAITLQENVQSNKILLCEPYYSGGLLVDIVASLPKKALQIDCIGVPKEFLENYGTAEEHDQKIGLTPENVMYKLEKLIHD